MSEEHRADLDTIAFPFQRKRDPSTKLVAAVQTSFLYTDKRKFWIKIPTKHNKQKRITEEKKGKEGGNEVGRDRERKEGEVVESQLWRGGFSCSRGCWEGKGGRRGRIHSPVVVSLELFTPQVPRGGFAYTKRTSKSPSDINRLTLHHSHPQPQGAWG